MANTPKPPLDEEGVEPLPNRIRKLPSAADQKTGRRTLVWAAMAAAALAIVVLLVAGALATDAYPRRGDEDIAAGLNVTGMELTDDLHWAYVFE